MHFSHIYILIRIYIYKNLLDIYILVSPCAGSIHESSSTLRPYAAPRSIQSRESANQVYIYILYISSHDILVKYINTTWFLSTSSFIERKQTRLQAHFERVEIFDWPSVSHWSGKTKGKFARFQLLVYGTQELGTCPPKFDIIDPQFSAQRVFMKSEKSNDTLQFFFTCI